MNGVKIIYGRNVLYCDRYRTEDKNMAACIQALSVLTGELEYKLYYQIQYVLGGARGANPGMMEITVEHYSSSQE